LECMIAEVSAHYRCVAHIYPAVKLTYHTLHNIHGVLMDYTIYHVCRRSAAHSSSAPSEIKVSTPGAPQPPSLRIGAMKMSCAGAAEAAAAGRQPQSGAVSGRRAAGAALWWGWRGEGTVWGKGGIESGSCWIRVRRGSTSQCTTSPSASAPC